MSDRVKGNLSGLARVTERIRSMTSIVYVGVPSTAEPEADGTSMATVAAANEFGTATIPERSFLRGGIRDGIPGFIELNRQNIAKIVEGKGMTDRRAKSLLGTAAANAVQKKIVEGEFVPNAPSTIAAKKSSRPLVDTGALRQSITWELREKGSGEDAGGGEFEGGL